VAGRSVRPRILGLTVEEARFIELKLALSRWLRERREAQKLTQVDLAQRLKSSQSRIAKMEAGDPSVSLDLLIRSLFALGATKRDLARVIAASKAPGEGMRSCLRAVVRGGRGGVDLSSFPDKPRVPVQVLNR